MYYLKKIMQAMSLLAIGTVIYGLFRQDIIFVGLLPFEFYRIELGDRPGFGLQMLVYNLPDALWYASLLVSMSMFLRGGYLNCYILLAAIISPFCLEIGQYFTLLSGTFDILDIAFYLITLLICLWKSDLKTCLSQVFK